MKNFYKRFLNESQEAPSIVIVLMVFTILMAITDIIDGIYIAGLPLIFAIGILNTSIKNYKRKY